MRPLPKLIAVSGRNRPQFIRHEWVSTLLVPSDTPGLTVREPEQIPFGTHGTRGELVFKDCRVAAENLLGEAGKSPLSVARQPRAAATRWSRQ